MELRKENEAGEALKGAMGLRAEQFGKLSNHVYSEVLPGLKRQFLQISIWKHSHRVAPEKLFKTR